MRCDGCFRREGQLTHQFAIQFERQGELKQCVFRYWMCRWCRSAWNRKLVGDQKPAGVIELLTDEQVLKHNGGGANG